MADLLQKQYSSVFSDPNADGLDSEASKVSAAESFLSDIPVTEKDMTDAMQELNPWSSGPDCEIPAKILRDCRVVLCVPLTILWKQSLASGYIPETFKQQFIAPIYKKDSKTDPANYRPVSLTSHIIKIFERVIRKYSGVSLYGHSVMRTAVKRTMFSWNRRFSYLFYIIDVSVMRPIRHNGYSH